MRLDDIRPGDEPELPPESIFWEVAL